MITVRKFDFLGARFNLVVGQIYLSLDRIVSFLLSQVALLKVKQATTCQLHSILGQMDYGVPGKFLATWEVGRTHNRPLQCDLKDTLGQCQKCSLWHEQIQLGP